MNKNDLLNLLKEYVKSESLINHCKMVALAMEFYAKKLNLSEIDIFNWYTAGLLHDLDWEIYPNEHPNWAINNILKEKNLNQEIIEAIKAHAPERTGKKPETLIEKYLFACDEISGFINAVSLIRPKRFLDLEVKSVIKRLKEPRFAANVSREDILKGIELIEIPIEEHVQNLINVFKNEFN